LSPLAREKQHLFAARTWAARWRSASTSRAASTAAPRCDDAIVAAAGSGSVTAAGKTSFASRRRDPLLLVTDIRSGNIPLFVLCCDTSIRNAASA